MRYEIQDARDEGCNHRLPSSLVSRPSYLALVALVALLALLSACGFHLRGAVVLPSAMEATVVEGVDPHGPLAAEIAVVLEGAGGRVVSDPAEAGARLRVLGERFDRRVAGVDAAGKVSEYELSYRLSFSLADPGGEVLVPEQGVSVSRSYVFNSASVLGKGEEEALLKAEMREQAVRQMLQRLQAALRRAPAAERGSTAP